MSRPIHFVGALGHGISPDVRRDPRTVALRYPFHTLLLAMLLRPFLLAWEALRRDGA